MLRLIRPWRKRNKNDTLCVPVLSPFSHFLTRIFSRFFAISTCQVFGPFSFFFPFSAFSDFRIFGFSLIFHAFRPCRFSNFRPFANFSDFSSFQISNFRVFAHFSHLSSFPIFEVSDLRFLFVLFSFLPFRIFADSLYHYSFSLPVFEFSRFRMKPSPRWCLFFGFSRFLVRPARSASFLFLRFRVFGSSLHQSPEQEDT